MSPPPLKDYGEVERLYRMGISIAEIGRRQDPPASRQTIWNALKRRGVLKHRLPIVESIRGLGGPGEHEEEE
jgi:hypothetical protein